MEDVTQDDVGELIEAELVKTRLAKKMSDDVKVVDALPSVETDIDTVEEFEKDEEQTEPLEETSTDTPEEFVSSAEQDMNTHTSDSEPQSISRDSQITDSET